GDVSDVVPEGFHPKRQREFPQEPFAGARGERRVENLAILAVGTIKTDVHARPPIPFFLAIVVKGELAGPAVVSLPGGVGALKNEIGLSVIANDKDEIALQPFPFCGQLAHVNPTEPIARYLK